MGMMTLGLVTGESITVEADGADEEQAVAEIEVPAKSVKRMGETTLFYSVI